MQSSSSATSPSTSAPTPPESVRDLLGAVFPARQFSCEAGELEEYSVDKGPVEGLEVALPSAVVHAESVEDVQRLMRLASEHGFSVVTRGAGTGVSGGANALPGCVVLSTLRMDSILQLNPEDGTAVVEPGVINADLNEAAGAHGLMYAPDPASYRTSTIGGNVATNAGGLRCAKYGVTRDSVLALDVVLADGTLIHTGHQTIKGVAGYDLTGLFTGSEGTLGVIVSVTVRLRPAPVQVLTLAAWLPDFPTAAAGVLQIGAARVTPAILEIMDRGTMVALDEVHGSTLSERGEAMLLVQTDGFGAAAEMEIIRTVLAGLGGVLSAPDDAEAEALVELRRHARGDAVETQIRVGEDVAVPKSQLVHYVAELERMAQEHGVRLKVVAHAADGNLHPTFWIDTEDAASAMPRLEAALDESIRVALEMGGTISGEHGIGSYKLRWLGWEQSEPVIGIQRAIKSLLDPQGILNPGRAIL